MTRSERLACLEALRLSQRQFAWFLGLNERDVFRWFRSTEDAMPAELEAWLQRHAEHMRRFPPPELGRNQP